MSKSMLIIDTPSSCDNCPLCILLDRYRCTVNKRWCGDEQGYFTSSTKPTWCPLKPYDAYIPIEWIKKKMAKHQCGKMVDSIYGALDLLLYDWEKENDTQI